MDRSPAAGPNSRSRILPLENGRPILRATSVFLDHCGPLSADNGYSLRAVCHLADIGTRSADNNYHGAAHGRSFIVLAITCCPEATPPAHPQWTRRGLLLCGRAVFMPNDIDPRPLRDQTAARVSFLLWKTGRLRATSFLDQMLARYSMRSWSPYHATARSTYMQF